MIRSARRLALAAALTLAAACESRSNEQPLVDPGPVPAELADGERLFNANCARCHGVLAVGTDAGPPLVHKVYEPSHHADFAFQRAVEVGVSAHHWRFGNMPPIAGVDQTEVERITAYVRWLQRQAGIQ
jgi:mono/diheme cytochrome c family protein